MTEYDYSPEAAERFQAKMRGIHDWVRDTERATPSYSTSKRSTSPPSYIKPRGMPPPPPVVMQMPIIPPPPPPQPYPQIRPHTSQGHRSGHHHHHRRSSSRARDDGHGRSRSNSTSSPMQPVHSNAYGYAVQTPPVPTPYGPIPIALPQRSNTHPSYGSGSYMNAQYYTYDPKKPIVIQSNGVYPQQYSPVAPIPSQARQPPLLKRLWTSLSWRSASRPQSAQLENRSPHDYSPQQYERHSRAKSRDGGRDHGRDRDRRRLRRQSLP